MNPPLHFNNHTHVQGGTEPIHIEISEGCADRLLYNATRFTSSMALQPTVDDAIAIISAPPI